MLTFVSALAFAQAKADLKTTLTVPATTTVNDVAALSVKVENIGSKDALNTTLTIDLPATNTSPTVFVLGTLGTYDARCSLSGTKLTCALGIIKKFKSTTVAVNYTPPWAGESLTVTPSVTTTSAESSTTNNSDPEVVVVSYIDTPITGPVDVVNSHCTGTGLVAYFECECFPSSIMQHDSVFAADGTISFPTEPDCEGTWTQPTDSELIMEYSCLGTVVANFSGNGVGGDCFEGLTTFPDDEVYIAPYEVCLQ
jgi:Domain of unknown function DUF11